MNNDKQFDQSMEMENLINLLKRSMADLIIEIRQRDDIKSKMNRADPSPLISFDQYANKYIQRDNETKSGSAEMGVEIEGTETLQIMESPRFSYDYGFNPLLYLAECIEKNSTLTSL